MACPLVPPEAAIPGNCGWCGKELPRAKDGSILHNRRWCLGHGRSWWINHGWTWARGEALKRDNYQCVRCGVASGTTVDGCLRCVGRWPHGDDPPPYHVRRPYSVVLEVNHIDPRRGAGYANGCWHHLDGLETLCHDCHQIVTAAQRAEGAPPSIAAIARNRRLKAESLPIWQDPSTLG